MLPATRRQSVSLALVTCITVIDVVLGVSGCLSACVYTIRCNYFTVTVTVTAAPIEQARQTLRLARRVSSRCSAMNTLLRETVSVTVLRVEFYSTLHGLACVTASKAMEHSPMF